MFYCTRWNMPTHQCTVCDKTFGEKSNLKIHAIARETFICDVCGKSLATKPSLVSHQQLHQYPNIILYRQGEARLWQRPAAALLLTLNGWISRQQKPLESSWSSRSGSTPVRPSGGLWRMMSAGWCGCCSSTASRESRTSCWSGRRSDCSARPASGPVPAHPSPGWKETWWEAEVSCHKHFVSPVGCGKQIAHTRHINTDHMCILYFQIICWWAWDSREPARSAHWVCRPPPGWSLLRPPPFCRGLLRPPTSSRGHLLRWPTARPLCRQHPYCWSSPHSHRPPPSCFVGHPAARALSLLHQPWRHSCLTSPQGHVGLATCQTVVDSGRGTPLPRTKWLEACRKCFPTVHPLGCPLPLAFTMWCMTTLNTLRVSWMQSWKGGLCKYLEMRVCVCVNNLPLWCHCSCAICKREKEACLCVFVFVFVCVF